MKISRRKVMQGTGAAVLAGGTAAVAGVMAVGLPAIADAQGDDSELFALIDQCKGYYNAATRVSGAEWDRVMDEYDKYWWIIRNCEPQTGKGLAAKMRIMQDVLTGEDEHYSILIADAERLAGMGVAS